MAESGGLGGAGELEFLSTFQHSPGRQGENHDGSGKYEAASNPALAANCLTVGNFPRLARSLEHPQERTQSKVTKSQNLTEYAICMSVLSVTFRAPIEHSSSTRLWFANKRGSHDKPGW